MYVQLTRTIKLSELLAKRMKLKYSKFEKNGLGSLNLHNPTSIFKYLFFCEEG